MKLMDFIFTSIGDNNMAIYVHTLKLVNYNIILFITIYQLPYREETQLDSINLKLGELTLSLREGKSRSNLLQPFTFSFSKFKCVY